MMIEVQFVNGLSGRYSGVFDVQTSLSKSAERGLLKDDLRKDKILDVTASAKPNLNNDPLYWEAITQLVCQELTTFGFKNAKEYFKMVTCFAYRYSLFGYCLLLPEHGEHIHFVQQQNHFQI